MQKNIFLTNKEIISEINKSKLTYCSYTDEKYTNYDHITDNKNDITPKLIEELRVKKSKPRGKPAVDIDTIPPEDIVIRVMTYEHVPLDPNRKKKSRITVESYAWTKFIPYKHYILQDNELKEVLRSHWVGSFQGDNPNGYFSPDSGKITNKLAQMFMLFVKRYANRANFRNYTYIDEMQAEALVQLCHVGLQFNEAKSDNPFSYYTTAVNNIFVRYLNKEKKVQKIRDDLIEQAGYTPSYSRQIANEEYKDEQRILNSVK